MVSGETFSHGKSSGFSDGLSAGFSDEFSGSHSGSAESTVRLILETSLPGIRMALLTGTSIVLAETLLPKGRGEQLDGLLQDVLDEARVTLSQIKQVLVTLGPGSFTGLRTGIAFAEGLCYAGNRELYSISTLKALRCLSTFAEKSGGENQFNADGQVSNYAGSAVVLKARPGWYYVGQDVAQNPSRSSADESGEKFANSSESDVDCFETFGKFDFHWHEAMIDEEALHQRSFANQVCLFDSTQGLSSEDFSGSNGCVDLAQGFSLQHFDGLWEQAEQGQVRPNYIQKSYAEQ